MSIRRWVGGSKKPKDTLFKNGPWPGLIIYSYESTRYKIKIGMILFEKNFFTSFFEIGWTLFIFCSNSKRHTDSKMNSSEVETPQALSINLCAAVVENGIFFVPPYYYSKTHSGLFGTWIWFSLQKRRTNMQISNFVCRYAKSLYISQVVSYLY